MSNSKIGSIIRYCDTYNFTQLKYCEIRGLVE